MAEVDEAKEQEELKELEKNCQLRMSVEKFDGYIVVNLLNVFSFDSARYFSKKMEIEVLRPFLESHSFFILNLKSMGDIDKTCLREFVQMQIRLKKQNKRFFLTDLNASVKDVIYKNGLDKTFEQKSTVRAALVELGIVKKKAFDVTFLNPFIDAVMRMMEVQCYTKAVAGDITVLKPNEYPPADICGTIGLVSDSFNGAILLLFKEDVYVKIGTRMLGEGFQPGTPQFMDAIGEMANIVLGQAKISLNKMGHNVQQALPSVSYGKDQLVKIISTSPSILVPFTVEFGKFHIQITTKNR